MDAIDKLSHGCFWEAEQHRIQRNKMPSRAADPMYIVTLIDSRTGSVRHLFVNHEFPIDRFRGDVSGGNPPIDRRWEIRSAQLLDKSVRGVG